MILVGNTGFVGSNLRLAADFDGEYNSGNVTESYGIKPDILVYAGVYGTKFLANINADYDMANIMSAKKNIECIEPKKLVLISTIDVYANPLGADEDFIPEAEGLCPYGRHRLLLENWVKDNVKDYLIVRLPGIYGRNLRKNLIYDLNHKVPTMLSREKMEEHRDMAEKYYSLAEDGFYHLVNMDKSAYGKLMDYFEGRGFTSWSFTDTRGQYQYYNLGFLWEHIKIALNNGLSVLNVATEPLLAGEIITYVTGNTFDNHLKGRPAEYDMRTKYDGLFGKKNGYIFDKAFCLEDIKSFVLNN